MAIQVGKKSPLDNDVAEKYKRTVEESLARRVSAPLGGVYGPPPPTHHTPNWILDGLSSSPKKESRTLEEEKELVAAISTVLRLAPSVTKDTTVYELLGDALVRWKKGEDTDGEKKS